MLLLRALNEYDELINPLDCGLASKELIYKMTYDYLTATKKDIMNKMSDQEKKTFVKESMGNYLVTHKDKLNKLFERRHQETYNTIHNFVQNKDMYSYFKLIYDLSSLPNHLRNGSRVYTNWISTSTDINKAFKYYDRQDISSLAVIDLETNGAFNEYTYAVDVSSKEIIRNIKWLSKKINKSDFETFLSLIKNTPRLELEAVSLFNNFVLQSVDKRFMGFSFAAASKEISIYEHIPKDNIITILEQLEVDLLCAGLLNENFYLLPISEQKRQLERFKEMILYNINKENNFYMNYVFNELYIKNHNISKITSNEKEKERIITTRNLMISKSQSLPSLLIKKQ